LYVEHKEDLPEAPQVCRCCGQQEFSGKPIKIEIQQVAQLVEQLIKIVEYQKYTCICSQFGETQESLECPRIASNTTEMHPFRFFILNKIRLTHGSSEIGFDGRKDAL